MCVRMVPMPVGIERPATGGFCSLSLLFFCLSPSFLYPRFFKEKNVTRRKRYPKEGERGLSPSRARALIAFVFGGKGNRGKKQSE